MDKYDRVDGKSVLDESINVIPQQGVRLKKRRKKFRGKSRIGRRSQRKLMREKLKEMEERTKKEKQLKEGGSEDERESRSEE